MRLSLATAGAVALALVAALPGVAEATSCRSFKVKNTSFPASVTRLTASGVGCVTAKRLAREFSKTRENNSGYTCRDRRSADLRASRVTLTNKAKGRTVTFRIVWQSQLPFPRAGSCGN